MLGSNPVHPLAPDPHEVGSTPRDNPGLKAPRPQVGQQLEHGLVHAFVIPPLEPGMTGGLQPLLDPRLEFRDRQPLVGQGQQAQQPRVLVGQQRWHIARQRRLHMRVGLPFGMVGDQAPQGVEGERRLKRDRVLGPQGAIVVEHRDPLGDRDEPGPSLTRRLLDKLQQPLLDLARGPARQRIVRDHSLGHGGNGEQQAARGQPGPATELHARTSPTPPVIHSLWPRQAADRNQPGDNELMFGAAMPTLCSTTLCIRARRAAQSPLVGGHRARPHAATWKECRPCSDSSGQFRNRIPLAHDRNRATG